jgi:hypothetical protein
LRHRSCLQQCWSGDGDDPGNIAGRLLYRGAAGRRRRHGAEAAYFNCVEIELNVVLSFVPRPFTMLIIASFARSRS